MSRRGPFLRCKIGLLDYGNCIELDLWKKFSASSFVVNLSVLWANGTTFRFVLSQYDFAVFAAER